MEPLSSRFRRLPFLLILLIALGLAGCQKQEDTSRKVQKSNIPVLNPASFEKTIAAHKGRVLVVNFFTTWCEPCRKELPELVSLANTYRPKGVDVIGVSLDKGGEKVLAPFLKKIKIPYPVYLGNEDLMASLKLHAIPTTYFYDKNGTRVETVQGALTRERLAEKIDSLLRTP